VKILHVIASVDLRGGGPIESVNSISAIWSKQGHECHVACLDDPSARRLNASALTIYSLGGGGKFARALRIGGYGVSFKLLSWLKDAAPNYDIIIVHGLWNFVSFGSWIALRQSGVPYFVFPHGMLDPWFIRAFPVKALMKAIFWRLFENRVLRDATGVLFTTLEERSLAAQSFRPYSAKPYIVGLGTREVEGDRRAQLQALAARMPQLEGRRFILFLSRIHPKKGIDLLIRAFARHASLHSDLDLVIAGPDQVGLQRSLMELSAGVGVASRVHWPGMLTGDAKWGAFAASQFFALPSHQENFGIAVAEALVLGTPVLITNKVNTWREIEQEQAGIVVDDNVEAVADGLRRLCSLSAEERATLSANARRCFRRHYDIDKVATDLIATLQRAGEAKTLNDSTLGKS
jgi:glycosyltransferase involved in cell wall biosynthesis